MLPDIGGTEFLIIAVVALVVFKPQDLPLVMRKVGEVIGKARRLASDFRASFEDMARQSELDELRKEVQAMRDKANKVASNPIEGVSDVMASTEADIRSGLEGQGDFIPPEEAFDAAPEAPAVNPPIVESAPEPAPKPKKPRKPRKPAEGKTK